MTYGISGITAVVVLDSVDELGQRIITFQLRYHRFIHGEFMTHRVFSRNASSSRAIPVRTMLKQVWRDPAMPVHWGINKPGMQASEELTGWKLSLAKKAWRFGAKLACCVAWSMNKIGIHKQIANRVLEPWQFIHVIVTATEWSNFLALRNHPMAQPEIQVLAKCIQIAKDNSTPTLLKMGEWHLPYVTSTEKGKYSLEVCKQMSTARNARVSYLTHEGKTPVVSNDMRLHDTLVGSEPIHASPTEHLATPSGDTDFHKNFRGWVPYRQEVEYKIYKSTTISQ